MHSVDLQSVQACINRALDLFRQTFTTESTGGGWYHQLATGAPGPSATAVGLSSFFLCGNPYEYFQAGLEFLSARQVRSDNPRQDGGWAVNTSLGHPVTEATGLAARLLGIARAGLINGGGPDARAACTWLVNNQNDDGGWGSYRGQKSRVWLTCMALRAIACLDSFNPAIRRGIDWLARDALSSPVAWGATPGASPTVPNTALVLITLADTNARILSPHTAELSEQAYEWLEANVRTDSDSISDDPARVEVFTVTRATNQHQIEVWTSTIWHHSLPLALSALVRHPTVPKPDLISAAVTTIINGQVPDGYWPGDESGGVSVWSVWPFLEALSDIERYCVTRPGDMIGWISPDVVVVRHLT
jgi:hypothetical protein